MPIPVVALDEAKTILARPRNAPIYDTQADASGSAIPTTLSFFANLATFQVTPTGGSAVKLFGLDTNLEGTPGGTVPKGSMFLWYDITTPVSVRNNDLSTVGNVGVTEELQRIRRARALTFLFASTPYFSEALENIPMGVGIDSMTTTVSGVNVFPVKNGRLHRDNRRRATVAGYPVVLTQNEQFTIQFVAYSDFLVTPSVNIWWTPTLHGLFIKGLQG